VTKQFSKTLAAFFAAMLFGGVGGRADIIFGVGNSPADSNIGSYNQTGSNMGTGQFLGDPLVDVIDAVTDTDLTVPAQGAARFEAASSDALFSTVTLTPIGLAWEIIELNPLNLQGTGTFQLIALDDDGNEFVSGEFALDDGNSRVFAQAINGQSVTKLTIQASGALINDVRQLRITRSTLAIPEPSSVFMLGFGGLVLLGIGRKSRTSR
jgi:hypothetical protein